MAEVLAWLSSGLAGKYHDPSGGRRELSAHPVSCGHVGEVGSSGPVISWALSNPCRKAAASKDGSDRSHEGCVCDSWQERAAGGWSRYQSKHPVTLSLLCLPGKYRGFQAPECQVKLKLTFMPAEVTSRVRMTK